MTEGTNPGAEIHIDVERLRSVVSIVGAERAWAFLSLIEERLANLASAGAGPDFAKDRIARIHQCAGSAAAMGLTALEKDMREIELRLHASPSSAENIGADLDAAAVEAVIGRLQATYASCLEAVFRVAPALAGQAAIGGRNV